MAGPLKKTQADKINGILYEILEYNNTRQYCREDGDYTSLLPEEAHEIGDTKITVVLVLKDKE